MFILARIPLSMEVVTFDRQAGHLRHQLPELFSSNSDRRVRPLFVGPMRFTTASWLVSGRPRQLGRQTNRHFVPIARPGRKMTNGDLEAGIVGKLLQHPYPQAVEAWYQSPHNAAFDCAVNIVEFSRR